MTEPTIFIVDDDPAMRDSLRWLLETIGHPVKTFENAQEFLDNFDPQAPGCLVLDVRLPGMSGLQLQQKMKADNIALPVIIISGHGDVPMAVKAMQQGALEFHEKPFRDQELLDSIQNALEIDATSRSKNAESAEIQACVNTLTPREKEVMELLILGNPNREVANQCNISVKTVEVHRARIMDKMKANSFPELIHMVLELKGTSAAPE
ncbi:Two-component transcriptional response regulator, LuxR family [hydrothermal vent metagenome]|uniref:Two-component transcriptional response regulator, LuxR family n=1 Tax=hydrothermal vent metagenome TaxID=652676 RepID=A0A3B0XQN3_9ZZZZ